MQGDSACTSEARSQRVANPMLRSAIFSLHLDNVTSASILNCALKFLITKKLNIELNMYEAS